MNHCELYLGDGDLDRLTSHPKFFGSFTQDPKFGALWTSLLGIDVGFFRSHDTEFLPHEPQFGLPHNVFLRRRTDDWFAHFQEAAVGAAIHSAARKLGFRAIVLQNHDYLFIDEQGRIARPAWESWFSLAANGVGHTEIFLRGSPDRMASCTTTAMRFLDLTPEGVLLGTGSAGLEFRASPPVGSEAHMKLSAQGGASQRTLGLSSGLYLAARLTAGSGGLEAIVAHDSVNLLWMGGGEVASLADLPAFPDPYAAE